MKLTSQMIKDKAKELGIGCIAIGNIERFKNAPVLMSPTSIFPEAYIEDGQLLWRDNDTLDYTPCL